MRRGQVLQLVSAFAQPNKRIKLMRRSAQLDWQRTAHRLCAVRWAYRGA